MFYAYKNGLKGKFSFDEYLNNFNTNCMIRIAEIFDNKYGNDFGIHTKLKDVNNFFCYLGDTSLDDLTQEKLDEYVLRLRVNEAKPSRYITNIYLMLDELYSNGYLNKQYERRNGYVNLYTINGGMEKHYNYLKVSHLRASGLTNYEAIDFLKEYAKYLWENTEYSYQRLKQDINTAVKVLNNISADELMEFDFIEIMKMIKSMEIKKLNFELIGVRDLFKYLNTKIKNPLDEKSMVELLYLRFPLYLYNEEFEKNRYIEIMNLNNLLYYYDFKRFVEYVCQTQISNNGRIKILRQMNNYLNEFGNVPVESDRIISYLEKKNVTDTVFQGLYRFFTYISFFFKDGKFDCRVLNSRIRATKIPYNYIGKKIYKIENYNINRGWDDLTRNCRTETVIFDSINSEIDEIVLKFVDYEIKNTDLKYDSIRNNANQLAHYFKWCLNNNINDYLEQISFDEYQKYLYSHRTEKRARDIFTGIKKFFMFLYENKITNKLLVKKDFKNHKYEPVYLSDYRKICDDNVNSLRGIRNIIFFDELKNDYHYESLKQFSIMLCKSNKETKQITHVTCRIIELLNFIGKPVNDILLEDIEEFYEFKDYTNRTGGTYMTYFKKFFAYLKYLNFIENDPLYKYNNKLDIKYQNNNIPLPVLEKILYCLNDNPKIQLAIMLGVFVGMRFSDVANLRRNCLYTFEDDYFIRYYCEKKKKTVENMIPYELYRYIKDYKEAYPTNTNMMFPTKQVGVVMSNPYVNEVVNDYIKRNNITYKNELYHFTFHQTRHTYAELLKEKNVNGMIIQSCMHHDNFNMTVMYMNHSEETQIGAYKKVSDCLRDVNIGEIQNVIDPFKKGYITEELVNGRCTRPKIIGKCQSSSNNCYCCVNFIPRKEMLENYIELYHRFNKLIAFYDSIKESGLVEETRGIRDALLGHIETIRGGKKNDMDNRNNQLQLSNTLRKQEDN